MVELFLLDDLSDEQLSVLLLGFEFYVELGVLLDQVSVLVVDPLGDLRHGLQVLIKLLLPLLEIGSGLTCLLLLFFYLFGDILDLLFE